MSQIIKHSESRVLWQIGNTQIVESEPDHGILPMIKTAVLFVSAITVAQVSPVIALSLVGYGAIKIISLATAGSEDSKDLAKNLFNDINTAEPVPSEWVPMPQAIDHPQLISSNTRLNAVDVPVVASVPSPSQPIEETKLLSIEATLALPLAERADYVMKVLADYGCDLRNLVGRPTLATGGLQRSGKTTLILLLAILEKAKGQKVFYVARDSDLYPIAFDGYASGSTDGAVDALMNLSDRINSGQMGALKGETWILDEFSSTAKEMPEKVKNQFWSMALTGFAKQGGRVRFIVHHKTASANGLPAGEAETFKSEVKMFWTERDEMSDGTYKPSGLYRLLAEVAGHYKETGETFTIPKWLKSDVNPAWHNAPCPVRSLLTFFPELDTRKGAVAQPLVKPREANPFAPSNVVPFTSAYKERKETIYLPCEDHEVDEEPIETTSTLSELREAFPTWKQKSLEVAALIVDFSRKKSGEALQPSRFKSDILKIRKDESLTNDRLKDGLLPQLVSKGFLTENNGRYQAKSTEGDYDF